MTEQLQILILSCFIINIELVIIQYCVHVTIVYSPEFWVTSIIAMLTLVWLLLSANDLHVLVNCLHAGHHGA